MKKLPLVYVIEDDSDMCSLYEKYLKGMARVKVYHNAISAISAIDREKPRMILLDILLDGPDGFTFLNEIVSYKETARIPIALITSLFVGSAQDFEDYGVVEILNKELMTPAEIRDVVSFWTGPDVKF
ncbi:response regulator [Candidatus Saccharibacteria bacterium]|nr:response regulator [Candidatus Saccharibacteria bacterium]